MPTVSGWGVDPMCIYIIHCTYPGGSMYCIFTYIYFKDQPFIEVNMSWILHGAYGGSCCCCCCCCCCCFFHAFALKNGKQVARVLNSVSVSKKHWWWWMGALDGRNPANQLRLVVYPIFSGFYTFQVVQNFFHQQGDTSGKIITIWHRLFTIHPATYQSTICSNEILKCPSHTMTHPYVASNQALQY